MAAVDQLPPMPVRGQGSPDGQPDNDRGGPDTGTLGALMEADGQQEQKKDVEEVMQKMRQDVGSAMRQFQGYAGQFPAAAKEADMVQKALNNFLRAIVKNAPGPNQSSPMVPA